METLLNGLVKKGGLITRFEKNKSINSDEKK